jgi:predicted PurR-regulated permease PerM
MIAQQERADMTEDHEALVGETQRLHKANRRWRIIALLAVLFAFVIILPFTIAIEQAITFFHDRDNRERAAINRASQEELEEFNRGWERMLNQIEHIQKLGK